MEISFGDLYIDHCSGSDCILSTLPQYHSAVACGLGGDVAGVREGVIAVFAPDDDVVKKWYAEYPPGFLQAPRDAPVLVARQWVAGGMVVQDDDSAGVPHAGDFEDLAGVDDGGR